MVHPAEPRSASKASLELGDGLRRPCSDDLDLTIREVARPPDDLELLGLPEHEPAEPDALYPAPDEPSSRCVVRHGQSASARARRRRMTT